MRYSARGEKSLFPLDGELNLHPDKYSFGLRRRIAEEVSKSSFDESVKSIMRTTGGKVPKRQMEELTDRIAVDFDAFYETRQCCSPELTEDLLIMSMDSKGIVMHEKDLREATRKAAERARKKLRTRLGKGEKRNRKRMATVGTVYSVGRHKRSAEEIMGKEKDACREIRPKVHGKRVWASIEHEPDAVADEVFREALSRDPGRRREWAMLVDGDPHQLDRILSCIKSCQVDVTIILDFIHLLEYLWKAAYCFHPEASEEAELWVAERALKILKGHASEAAAGIRRSATLRGLSEKARGPADKCADYIVKYRKLLCYDKYLSRGLPISTGVIEGACRHLIKDRMDLTGARWRLKSAEAVLKLRSLNSSGDFDEYMKFHKAREFERSHKVQYKEFPLPKAA
jgi:hypothetical protein